VISVATAVPRRHVAQDTAKGFARVTLADANRDLERLLPVFDNVEVEGRYFFVPPEWLYEDHTLLEKNALSREIWQDYGSMSDVTVLFVLERFLESEEGAAGEHDVLSALGPGFSAGRIFFRC
jgi:predicted naringenin-chalcone synthase